MSSNDSLRCHSRVSETSVTCSSDFMERLPGQNKRRRKPFGEEADARRQTVVATAHREFLLLVEELWLKHTPPEIQEDYFVFKRIFFPPS